MTPQDPTSQRFRVTQIALTKSRFTAIDLRPMQYYYLGVRTFGARDIWAHSDLALIMKSLAQ